MNPQIINFAATLIECIVFIITIVVSIELLTAKTPFFTKIKNKLKQ